MKTVFVWAVILIPAVIIAMYIGQSLDSDTAALAMGAIIGLMFAALAALITWLVRDERDMRQRRNAQRREREWVLEGEWREAGGAGPSTNSGSTNSGQGDGPTGTRMLPEGERALVVRR